jgi:hypothetical protein
MQCSGRLSFLRRKAVRSAHRGLALLPWLTLLWVAACGPDGEPLGPMGPMASSVESPEGFVDPLSAPSSPAFSLASFAGAKTCGSCHPQHYEEWSRSSHAHAMEDPVFRALLHRQREDQGTAQDRFCTQCHSAIGTRSGDIEPGFDFAELAPLTGEGVTCEACHRVTALQRTGNSGHLIDPSAPLQGPIADARAPHATEYSDLLQSAAFCGGCHDVTDPRGIALESPFAEWKSSPAAQSGTPCQSCHMPTYEGYAANVEGVPERTLHRHTFTGVDSGFAPHFERELSLELEQQSRALLVATVALELEASLARPGSTLDLKALLHNLVDGHRVPTGSSFFRQFWLAIEVKDASGALLYESGMLDEQGDLFDAHHERSDLDSQLALLGRTLLDEEGEPTLFPWRVASLEDHSMAPLGDLTVRYGIPIPRGARLPLSIRARLRFRGFSPRLLRELGLHELLPRLHIVDIATAERVLEAVHTNGD